MYTIFRRFFVAIFTIIIAVQCANPGSPSGGPKDEQPPVILSSYPENSSTNFNSEKITIKFDELVKFKDLKKQLVISPPMKYDPIIKPTGSAMDKVKIQILDTLAENTTYTLNFGNSLQDNNEGNIYSNFRYVFSTGDYIDSLSINGKISDAFTDSFDKNIMVMLYEVDSAFNDSTIFNSIPTYVTSTIESDTFKIDNAKAGTYLMIALEEKSRNLKFNPNQDKIAFYPEFITLPDSNKYELKLYKQEPDFSIKRPIHARKGRISFDFEGNSDDIKITRLLPIKSDTVMDMLYFSKYKDSASYWYSAREADSIQFLIQSAKYNVNDTVVVTLKKQKEVKPNFEPKNRSGLTPDKRLEITSNSPISSFVKDSISIINLVDSSSVNFNLSIKDHNKLLLNFEPDYKQKYSVQLLPGAITNFFGEINDTIIFNSSVKAKTEYGEIIFNIKNVASYPIIVDLINEKGDQIYERIIAKKEQDFVFSNLSPGKYRIRMIYDENENDKWDPGNFLKKQMPEEVKYFPDIMDIKANWNIEQDWILLKE
jgi:uncharacterized protein (DUF2141 family)